MNNEKGKSTDIVNPSRFQKGVSGNPAGRPKGSKNQITLLKQSMELALRDQAAPDIGAVLDKAVELALEGHPGMIKMLLELHMTKGSADEAKATEKVAIQINSMPSEGKVEVIEITSDNQPEEEDNG